MNKPWSLTEKVQLLNMKLAGATNAEIGRALGRSRESIKKQVQAWEKIVTS